MPSHFKNACVGIAGMRLVALVVLCGTVLCSVGSVAVAQDRPTPPWELYGGYSFFYPGCDVHGILPGGLLPVSSCLKPNPWGAGATVTYNFNRWLGVTGDISGHWGRDGSTIAERLDHAAFYNLSGGPKVTFRSHHFSPFLEALLGEHRLAPEAFQHDDEFGFMAGGGLDLNLGRRFAWRMVRADYVFSNHHFGPEATVPATEVRGVRLQSGLVFMVGGGTPAQPAASCSVQPVEVTAGEAVTANTTASNFNPRHSLTYNWSSTGGQIAGRDSAARIDTNGLAGGSYTATARVSDDKASRNRSQAICSATFSVKELPKNPPSVSCSSNPASVPAGSPSIITCACTSPDNLPVTVSDWSASDGTVSANGSTAALNTSGAAPGTITVTATCSDPRGLNARALAQVMVENPPPVSAEFQQLEARLVLHSIYFPTARPTVQNPDGGLLDSQRQTLILLAEDFKKYLETKPDAHLTLEGHADPRASVQYNQALSERRVERTRAFLIEHGVPEANLETKAFGDQHNLTTAQVKDAVERSPDLTPEQRQRVLDHMTTIALASNRRVDITLSTTGQRSVRQFPFNAADSLTLIRQ